jgi:membrane-associated protease RseP (regulator of RpoE activity)
MTKEDKRILFQIALFIATFITTTLAGAEWAYGRSIFMPDYSWTDFIHGLEFSIPLLAILTVHEFGHYFTALYHRVKVSLPYYIPLPPIVFSLGTLGAVIRLRSKPENNLQTFDIGVAGPLAGFVVALGVLIYGFATLPPADYIFQFHPEYKQYGLDYAKFVYSPEYYANQKNIIDIQIGKNLIFLIAEQFVSDPTRIPNAHELMHYPALLAAYVALFITSLNLLPIGQLDGGHVIYGLFGFKNHKKIATIFFIGLIFYAGLGLSYIRPEAPMDTLVVSIPLYLFYLYICLSGLQLSIRDTIMYSLLLFACQFLLMALLPQVEGYYGWLLFGLLIGRFIGVQHPPSEIEQPLDAKRIILGWLALLVFILCFSLAPIREQVIGG